MSRPTSSGPSTAWASRKRNGSSWRVSPRSTNPRSSTTPCTRSSNRRASSFLDTDSALKQHPDLFKQYFGTIIPPADNKLAALNSAVWAGGSFIYIPKGVKVEIPLQAYFRINAENMGQFERTLIICDEDSFVHYIEGCTAPIYTTDSLHSAVVEIIVKRGARCRYTTVQNWSTNVFNLVTKRAVAYGDATMEWVDGNLGSQITMKYPSIFLMEPGAKGDVLSVAFAGKGQHQDAGGKAVHVAPNTSSNIVSKSISKAGGRTSYRGHIKVYAGAKNSKSFVRCDALLLDEQSRSDTYPTTEVDEERSRSATKPRSARSRTSSSSTCSAAVSPVAKPRP